MTQENQLNLFSRVNMTGKVCERCGKGTYEIADLNDEIQGERHCIMCGHFTKAWKDGWTVNRT